MRRRYYTLVLEDGEFWHIRAFTARQAMRDAKCPSIGSRKVVAVIRGQHENALHEERP